MVNADVVSVGTLPENGIVKIEAAYTPKATHPSKPKINDNETICNLFILFFSPLIHSFSMTTTTQKFNIKRLRIIRVMSLCRFFFFAGCT
jgi:hypothetical protein